jgi:hypothetical protein
MDIIIQLISLNKKAEYSMKSSNIKKTGIRLNKDDFKK